jgi:hypothetical protein
MSRINTRAPGVLMSAFNLFSSVRNRTAFWAAATLLLSDLPTLQAHYCGPPVIRCQPGDLIRYYILSDMAEVGDSFYSVFSQSNPSVAPVVFFTPVARYAGLYVFQAQTAGINDASLFWS